MWRLKTTVSGAMLGLMLASAAAAALSSSDRAVLKEMTEGDLYLRNNVPCRYTSGGFGIGAEVVTEVSPTAVDWEKNLKAAEDGKKKTKRRGVDTIFWGFGPNDAIHFGKLYFKSGDVIELWAEGAKPKNVEVWIRFVGIRTLDDFKKAYDLILSKRPIQEDHPDWPADIRKAISEHRVVEGMTKAQAFAVVGTPANAETSDEGGKNVDLWFPRQETGASGGWGKVISETTGFPASLRFVDNRLTAIAQTAKPVNVNLGK